MLESHTEQTFVLSKILLNSQMCKQEVTQQTLLYSVAEVHASSSSRAI